MKLKTHYVFSFGLSTLALTVFGIPLIPTIIISFIISVAGNIIIDSLGHEIKDNGQILRRSPKTHTVPRSMLWGLLVSLPLLFPIYLFQYSFQFDYISYMIAAAISGIIVGPSHMLLDSLTEKGIYVKKNGNWERAALAHRRFDDPLANGLAVIAGIVMFILAFNLSPALL